MQYTIVIKSKYGGTPPAIYNRPDIVVWYKDKKECKIIDICVPLDVNVAKDEKEKRDKYLVLAAGLKRIYEEYSFQIIPIVIGATGYVPKSLKTNLLECGFDLEKSRNLIPDLQRKALRGTMKVIKTSALKMR